ncbi:MAG: hypothetical protein H7256_12220 [Bdellovibrio sp.]|nr:hypothetical protein [Bdellovibrio sp.]
MDFKLDLAGRQSLIKNLNLDDKKLNVSLSHKTFVKSPSKTNILFEDQISESQIIQLVMYRDLRHIIQNSLQSADEKIEFLNTLIKDNKDYFALDFNMLEEGSAGEIFEFSALTDREELIAKICDFCMLDPSSSRATRAVETMEELIMNAQINAPLLRQGSISARSFLKVEYSDSLMAISAIDYYGSLDWKKFLKKIENGLALGLDKALNFGRGGAGIGSTIIFRNCDSIFLGVIPQKKTRVSVIMPYKAADKKYENIQKSIHIIES